MYLDLGLVGVAILLLMLWSAYGRVLNMLKRNLENSRAALGMIIMVLIYNLTESAFRESSLVWYVFLVVSIELGDRNEVDGLEGQATQLSRLVARE